MDSGHNLSEVNGDSEGLGPFQEDRKRRRLPRCCFFFETQIPYRGVKGGGFLDDFRACRGFLSRLAFRFINEERALAFVGRLPPNARRWDGQLINDAAWAARTADPAGIDEPRNRTRDDRL